MTISVIGKKKQVKKSFEELLVDLKTSNSEKVRYNAARVLGEMGDSAAVEPLIDVLRNDKNGSVRLYAARALGELGDSKATEYLIESLREDRNVDVRVRAARALGRLGGKIVVEPLVEALNDDNPQVCITATDALIEIGDVATDALMGSLDHEKVNVRCDATRALGEIGNKKAVDKIINMLYDEWVNVRIYAVTSLGKLNDTKAVPALIDVMKNEKAGVKLFENHSKMSAMGLSPKIIYNHLLLGKRLVDYLTKEFKPDLVLMIDYGAFNLSISKFLKKHNIKTFYYIPPQVWASRKWRINTIKKNIDKVLCIFPFEVELYKSYGIDVHYCGHPLVKQLPEKANRDEFFEKHGLDKNKKLVSVFPGSRVFELKYLMQLFIKSAKILQQNHPEIQFVISHAPNLTEANYNKYLKGDKTFKIIKGENQALLSVSDALILASGTVALEAALYQVPMIISYKGPWLFYFIYLIVLCSYIISSRTGIVI